VDAPGDARPLEVDMLAIPRVFEVEALVQVLRNLFRDVAGLLVRKRMRAGNLNGGHRLLPPARSIAKPAGGDGQSAGK